MPRTQAVTLLECLPLGRQLELAVRTKKPAGVARHFAAHAGQFYDRERFDRLARETRALYATTDPAAAACFQSRLDRRLRDRDREPVRWDVAPAAAADGR
jgi:hypothetical protein